MTKSVMKGILVGMVLGVMLFASDAKDSADRLGAESRYPQAIQKAKKSHKMVVMVVVKEHCRWCHKLIERTLSDPKVKARMAKDYILLIVDRDDTYPAAFNEDFFPSVFYIDAKTQKSVYENIGYVGVKDFLNDLDGALETRNALYGK